MWIVVINYESPSAVYTIGCTVCNSMYIRQTGCSIRDGIISLSIQYFVGISILSFSSSQNACNHLLTTQNKCIRVSFPLKSKGLWEADTQPNISHSQPALKKLFILKA